MANPASVACPRCGASIAVSPEGGYVTCSYCGTSAFVTRPGVVAPPNVPVIGLQPGRSSFPVGCVIGGALLVVLGVAGAGAALFMVRSSKGSGPTAVGANTAVVEQNSRVSPPASDHPPGANEPSTKKPPRLEGRRAPLLADFNGDGAQDLVIAASYHEAKGFTRRYAGFDGLSGRELWRSGDIGSDLYSSDAALEGSRLLVVNRSGKVTAFDTKTGDEQWSTTLGDRVTSFCRAKEPDAVRVRTNDERTIALDLKTGRQTAVAGKPACERANSNGEPSRDPADRSDSRAPAGVKSVLCGGIRVMGDRNFSLPDQCKAQTRIDPDRLEGMSARALWQHEGGFLVLGSRRPGTRIPMVGFAKAGRLLWSSDVPESNPLEAREGAPDHVALDGARLFVAYEPQSGDKSAALTAFDASTGKRLWNSVLPGKLRNVSNVKASAHSLFVSVGDNLVGYRSGDGKQLFLLGDGD